ncbi:prolipoprotein diacylglyceryl transferase [Acidipropionibacterium virtanenii]|uniref:Phosphatidylglycerol--prolipoprotein diacylglyceryl transferase n=1 Tax=Acidipropionibacterium virtanenii TaxID=2057246 RepID=A0A344UU08_9ACTN|nr:Prolipoprotein diacylglyceryl transferase [Acidipropionibacterium virtanenii]
MIPGLPALEIALSIPSPSISGFSIGPVRIHFYALCILAGIVVAYLIGGRRYRAGGGRQEDFETVTIWAVIAGIVGARIYHVITDHELYFGPGRTWYHAFFIWQGGLGIWGSIAGGALAVWLVCRSKGLRFCDLADALAPGILLAQGIGRLGNWFNQELFGGPTSLPWGLRIDLEHRPLGYLQYSTFHPTFLYELIWNVAGACFLLWADRRWKLGRGKLFCLYVVTYTFGRFWVERLRIDPANHVNGWRINSYTSLLVFLAGLVLFIWLLRNKPGATAPETGVPASGNDAGPVGSEAADGDGSELSGGDEPDGASEETKGEESAE